MEEIFKKIPNYENYQVSNLGNVKSLKRNILLKQCKDFAGYSIITICDNGTRKTAKIHKLVAICFLNHIPDGTQKIVVDHINNNKDDNTINNLQLITQRENVSKSKIGFSSKYTGVSWSKSLKKWVSQIESKGRTVRLGLFTSEIEAKILYKSVAERIDNGECLDDLYPKKTYTSKYKGVSLIQNAKKFKWKVKKKGKWLGNFKTELEASIAYKNAT